MVFSDLEKRALEVFVTSADSPIYAVRNTIPPEVFGAFGSYFSRNPKDLREHLLDAIKGQIEGEETEVKTLEVLEKLANGGFSDPSSAISSGLKKSQDFFKKWYGTYSHKSIANTVWIPMVATNVSQLFARKLAYDQLAFFIEQSTRFVEWDIDKMFLDPLIMASRHRDLFVKTLEGLTDGYQKIKGFAFDFYSERNPFPEWLSKQPDKIKKADPKIQKNTYKKQVMGAALDVARFLLPQATRTNIAWILDARSTEFDISSWKGDPLTEIREAARLIEEHAGQIAPSLLKYTDESLHYSEKLRTIGIKQVSEVIPFDKGVSIISYDDDSLNKTVAHALKERNFGGTFDQRYREVIGMSFEDKMRILRAITQDRTSFDEWVETEEDFDLTKVTAEIRTDIGSTRDWRRHQRWDRGESLYTTENGFYMPPMIDDMNPKAKSVFIGAVEMAHEANSVIRKDLPFESQYIVPMATKHAITMSAGLDQMQYMLWTRTTPQGNFSYREDAFNLAEAFVRTHPWVLGYQTYPEGKSFREIYEAAPLKGILRLQTGETGLHT